MWTPVDGPLLILKDINLLPFDIRLTTSIEKRVILLTARNQPSNYLQSFQLTWNTNLPEDSTTNYKKQFRFTRTACWSKQKDICGLESQRRVENGSCTRVCTTMYHTFWKTMIYISTSMKMTIAKLALRNMTRTLWVDSYAVIPHVVPTDGQARWLLSPYECIMEHNTMRGYTANVVEDARNWVNRVWMIRMQKEWLTVLKSGVE